jgi:hypothetical protein
MAVVHPTYGNVVIGGTTSSPVYTSSGTGASWASTNAQTTAHGKLKVEGKDADIYINGQSLSEWMSTVDRRLTILRPNSELQEKYSALQDAYDHYKTLESLLYEQE